MRIFEITRDHISRGKNAPFFFRGEEMAEFREASQYRIKPESRNDRPMQVELFPAQIDKAAQRRPKGAIAEITILYQDLRGVNREFGMKAIQRKTLRIGL